MKAVVFNMLMFFGKEIKKGFGNKNPIDLVFCHLMTGSIFIFCIKTNFLTYRKLIWFILGH